MDRCVIMRLEPRRLFAGNVTAVVSDGSFVITGDGAANAIEIRGSLADAQTLFVTGLDGTTVNGPSDQYFASQFPRHVIIRMNGGDDSVLVADADILKDLRVDLGDGADTFSTARILVRQNLVINGGDGDDQILITTANVRRRTGVNAGNDDDLIALSGGSFKQHVRLLGSYGDDTLTHFNVSFGVSPELDGGSGADTINLSGQRFDYDFDAGRQGWRYGFADWRAASPDDYHFIASIRGLPAELESNKKGFMISGRNGSDDLFMYLTRQLRATDGIVANQRYLVMFDITFASNATTGSFGVGGSPGDSVYLKAGASGTAPAIAQDIEGINRLNLDHGQQASGGADISVAGTIANGIRFDDLTDPADPPFRSVRRIHTHPTPVQADADGNLNLVVGTDSGFESFTTLYYQQIHVALIPLPTS